MKPSELRRRGVIYVTMVMTIAVRALSLFLTVWLTAAAAFPPCCWSMAYAHEHQQTPDVARSDATSAEHHHDHPGSGDTRAVRGTESVLSSMSAYNCDVEFADSATTLSSVQRGAMHPTAESAVDFVVQTRSARDIPRSDTSPPGSTFPSAFLSPLRI